MEVLRAQGLALRRGGRELFGGLSFALRKGQRLGLVGPNGAGKSILLTVLAGLERPDEGEVWRAPGLRIGTPQDLSRYETMGQAAEGALAYVRGLEAQLRAEEAHLSEDRLEAWTEAHELFGAAGGYEAEVQLTGILTRLGFPAERYDQPVASLSGGERARLALALVLAQRADVLVLDEPSTHLDIMGRRWLAQTLAGYGTLVLASHDRALLDAVCTDILELKGGKATLYLGNYRRAHAAREGKRRGEERAAREARKTARRLTGTREKLLRWGRHGQRQAVERRLGALESLEAVTEPEHGYGLALGGETMAGNLLDARHLHKVVGGRTVIDDASLRLDGGDKLALVGPNGSGKSTLLEMLALELESDHPEGEVTLAEGVRFLYLDQEARGFEPELSPFEALQGWVTPARAASLLALVGLDYERWHDPSGALSAGERARAALALVMASEANTRSELHRSGTGTRSELHRSGTGTRSELHRSGTGLLLLDEPTNGLDLVTIERLEEALMNTQAAFILVSHDEALVRRVAKRVLSLEAGKLVEFRGGFEGYLRGSRRLEPDLPALSVEAVEEESLEARLERLEDERLWLEELFLDPLKLSEREEARLKHRYLEVIDALSLLYDARLPPAAPRLFAREGPVAVWLEGEEMGRYRFASNAGLGLTLLKPGGAVGHLVLQEAKDRCTLAWALLAILRTTARLAFERLDVEVLQLQSRQDLGAAGFRPAGDAWWLMSREDFERLEGYVNT